MKTILASVYAVNPYKGSEDGTGWNLVLQIARFNKVIAITRENNRPAIEKYMYENYVPGAQNIRFEYYDLPYWMRFWKKGSRGALLYYYLWQMGMPSFIRKKKLQFDIVHNLNFHNDWTPSFLWKFKKPFVWGPVGHHPRVPKQFIAPVYGTKKWMADALRWKAKQFFWNIDPFLRVTKTKAERILAINSDVDKKLNAGHKLVLMPAVATNDMLEGATQASESFNIISVGRFIALKGFDVTIRSFAAFLKKLTPEQQKTTRLRVVGDGPELGLIQALIKELGVEANTDIIRWIEREKMKDMYLSSKVFFFPSHEGAGMVVPEALSCGLPVLCFDNEGPGEFIDEQSGIRVPYLSYDGSIALFAEALEKLYHDKACWQRLSEGARKQFENNFRWDTKGETLKMIYEQIA
jgi:glycosyltransferase involved in cell wall biosynthesis